MINIHHPHINQHHLLDRTDPIANIVLHYTVSNFKSTYHTFKKNIKHDRVASHYLIDTNGEIYQLVKDDKIARHAGLSMWNRVKNLNMNSIGIEIVNFGFNKEDFGDGIKIKNSDNFWYPFPKKQIDAVVKLTAILSEEYKIEPYNIIGHSDIAIPAGRKQDPGILFPWKELANHGLGLWHNIDVRCDIKIPDTLHKGSIEEKRQNFVKKLNQLGYANPRYVEDTEKEIKTGNYEIKFTNDRKTIKQDTDELIKNYNMHYRQEKGISFKLDALDFKIIDSLLCIKDDIKNKKLTKEQLISLYDTEDQNCLIEKKFLKDKENLLDNSTSKTVK